MSFKDPVTRLMVSTCTLTNGEKFDIVHDLEFEGGGKSFMGNWRKWHSRTNKFTQESFIRFVKNKQPDCIFLSKKEYDRLISVGNVIPATKEEWESENN